jgi:hypothetical protein
LELFWNVAAKYACTSAGSVDVTYVTPTRLMVGQLCANPPFANPFELDKPILLALACCRGGLGMVLAVSRKSCVQ